LERSSISRWRSRMGEEKLAALLQESLSVAVKTEALKPSDLSHTIVDTTVQPKNVTFPTDAKLVNRAREKLVKLAKKMGVVLRQSYVRVGKLALMKHQRYAHAKQFNRANRSLRKLKTYLGRVIRDIARRTDGDPMLKERFAHLMELSRRVLAQKRGQRGPKVYSLHAPEVECIPDQVGDQGQAAQALRVRRQGERGNDDQAFQGRAVRHPCRILAGQSV
jgi:IS5 family transposase